MKYFVAILMWPIVLAALPAKDMIFGGSIKVWPFILAACLVAATQNPRAGAIIALAVLADHLIQSHKSDPVVYQFAVYTTLAFAALLFVDILAGLTLAIVALLYLSAWFGVEWRLAMIISEIIITAGLSASVIDGPSGGIYSGQDRGSATRRVAYAAISHYRGLVHNRAGSSVLNSTRNEDY